MRTEPLAFSYRAGNIEGVHRGVVAVVDAEGKMISSIGDADYMTYLRSSVKMLQAIPIVESGAAERFGFGDDELALACASHTAADYHLQTVDSMLRKIKCDAEQLECGGHLPEDEKSRDEVIRSGTGLSPRYNNCSGKHAGMLAASLANDWDVNGYSKLDHPLQQRILSIISEYSGMSQSDIPTGIDGCSLPTYLLSIKSGASAAAAFMSRSLQNASPDAILLKAISASPEMVHSKEGFDTVLMNVLNGRCYAKRGAMGVMLVGLLTNEYGPIGIAAKMENGDNGPMPTVMVNLLAQLDLISPEEYQSLNRFARIPLKNWNGISVGEICSNEEIFQVV